MNNVLKKQNEEDTIKSLNKLESLSKEKDASLLFTSRQARLIQREIDRLNKERKAIKKYVHNHTITYIDNGIECCKPDEYFNISWVENMLCGNFENLETLFEGEDKE